MIKKGDFAEILCQVRVCECVEITETEIIWKCQSNGSWTHFSTSTQDGENDPQLIRLMEK